MGLDLQRNGDVVIATWRDGENRLNPDTVKALDDLASEIEHEGGPCALVLTGEGKFFSNGLDLERFEGDRDEMVTTVAMFEQLLGRLFVLPVYTVAAINGHAFAGGAMLTCAFDYRVMREDRGYWCLNEADIGLPLSAQMAAAVLGRLPRATALEAMLTARRYSAQDALVAGIVEAIVPEDRLLDVAVERAAMVAAKHRDVVAAHKRHAFCGVAAACGWVP
ncbi:MAG TPA: enoyl-CoA hydratase/isomerase family protein [Acidimicrobiales bacterium]|jgi:enoyl-CoA hydratase/carnithine racemase|nr:enoyl-CoA hydratase/isomerase family protein [Acidimicrobiales bacterium]